MLSRLTRVALGVALATMSSHVLEAGQAAPREPRTFTKDVAPILFERCVTCHRPGGGAPFSLLTYQDVQPRAPQIAEATSRRYMPLWKPSPGHGGPFVGERRLTDEQIATIAAWVEQGAAEGSAADMPAAPELSTGWRLGTPDLVLRLTEQYALPSSGPDVYRNFVLQVPITERKYVAGLEFRPGSHQVHHAILRVDPSSSARELDAADPAPGFDGMLVDRGHFPDGHFLGWTPGKVPTMVPKGMPWQLNPGTDLVLQVHIMPMGHSETLQAEVGLYFADAPPAQTPALIRLNSSTIDIAAGSPDYVVEDRYTLPVDVSVLAIYPHAHFLGRRIESFAELPGGGTRPLLLIEDWDFNWQDEYRYADPVLLPQGSTVVMRYQFDNSAANPRNPNSPPRRVTYGPQSTDEMAELTLQVLPRDPSTYTQLVQDVWRKLRTNDIASFRALVARNPNDHVSHTALGVRYFEEGDVPTALLHLQEAVRLAPAFATGHNNLATVLLMTGRPTEAITHFRRAVELQPDYVQAHNNLGSVLQSMGQVEEAARHFETAIQLQPRHAAARYNLANLMLADGRLDQAVAQYRVSLALAPDAPETHNNLARALTYQRKRAAAVAEYREALKRNPNFLPSLADLSWLLATSPEEELRNPSEAVRLAERANQLAKDEDIVLLDRLAAAYASDAKFDRAIATAQRAITLAQLAMEQEFADQVRRRLELYRQLRPFVVAP